VPGISFRDGAGEIVHCPDGSILSDLDALPFPDRDGVMEHYRDRTYSSFVYGSPSDILMTSRGCPYRCSFCFKVCGRYRSRSSENVLAEIDWVMEHIAPASIQFMDDSFTIQKTRTHAILDGLIDRRYSLKLKVRSRVDAVDEALLRKMKRAGVDTVVYGLESGSEEMLQAFNKRTQVQQNVAACRMTRRAGLNCLGDMILFYPGETRATLRETDRFIRAANPTAVKFYVLSPLPRTKVYDEAKANGTLVSDWSTGGETPWVRLPDFAGIDEMQAIAKRMYLKTLLRPSRALGILRSYGQSMLRNPRLSAAIIVSNVLKKMKY
jgi:anaerobic magnesium-protoporphyrin IX monomethyl ester cyclase